MRSITAFASGDRYPTTSIITEKGENCCIPMSVFVGGQIRMEIYPIRGLFPLTIVLVRTSSNRIFWRKVKAVAGGHAISSPLPGTPFLGQPTPDRRSKCNPPSEVLLSAASCWGAGDGWGTHSWIDKVFEESSGRLGVGRNTVPLSAQRDCSVIGETASDQTPVPHPTLLTAVLIAAARWCRRSLPPHAGGKSSSRP
jgi:hypothetical protein